MKKRGKQFFALWLALMLSAVSVPQAVQLQAAGSVKNAADPEYRITHQPTAEEPCLKLNKEGASFAWYKAAPAVCEVVPDKKQDNQIEAETTEYSYNEVLGGWEASDGLLALDIPAATGDLVTVTPCSGFSGTVQDGSGNSLSGKETGAYTCGITAEGIFSLRLSETDSRSFWAKVTITRQMPADRVTGQDSDTFTGAPGTYVCVATFGDGVSVISSPLEVPGYDITVSSAGNGSCRIQAGGKEVSSAALGQKITIIPEPADTYELDAITVTKKDQSSTPVTVTDQSFTMPSCPVTVHVTFRRPSYRITLPEGTGYHASSQQSLTTEYGSNFTFTVTLDEGYQASKDFSVSANGTILTPTSSDGGRYQYTLYHINKNQTITVSGVTEKDTADTKDEIPPEITISLDKNTFWKDFMHLISFGTFFREKKSLTITAKDAQSGIREGSVKYYLAEQDLFAEDKVYTAREVEERIPSWTEYREPVLLPEDKSYVLYAKAEDNGGNISYASTTGIVIDTTAPSIDQMEDGKIFYGNSTFTIRDHYLAAVVVDGMTTKVNGSTHTLTIPADNKLHTIHAADRAGNAVSYQFYVHETWLRDGISVSGRYSLKPDTSYKLCPGKWKVAGDNTVYQGNSAIYVSGDNALDFQKQ